MTRSPNVAVIYYSAGGTNHRLALAAADAAEQAGAAVRLRRVPETAPPAAIARNAAWRAHLDATRGVPEATLEDLAWAGVYVFSAPTRYGSIAGPLRAFLDTTGGLWAQGQLADKIATVMTSAGELHGGQETTLLGFYATLAHWGAVIVPPGYTDPAVFAAGGNPYGTSVTAAEDGNVPEAQLAAARHQARRAVEVGRRLAAGRAAEAGRDGFAPEPTPALVR